MNKPMRTMIIALAIVFGGLFAFNLIKTLLIKHFLANYKPPAVSVSSVTVSVRDWYPEIHAVGNFEAINGVEINTEVAGKITTIYFNSGQFVRKDDPLLDLDDSIEQAILQSNVSALTLAKLNYERQVELFKRGATPKSSVDEANAKAQQAQASLDQTHAQISHKHIKAPFSGRLGIRQVNIGQYITPGQTDIVTLQSLDPLYLKFYLPEQDLIHIHVNQTILFTVEHNTHYVFQGKINAISSKIDTSLHNVEVQAELLNCPSVDLTAPYKSSLIQIVKIPSDEKPLVKCSTALNLKHKISDYYFIPGMFALIRIELPPIPKAIVLPSTALSYSLYGNSVYVIEKDPKDNKTLHVHQAFVKTGDQKGNYTVIKSGLKPGQLVVNSGQLKLQNGTEVVINNEISLSSSTDLTKIGH